MIGGLLVELVRHGGIRIVSQTPRPGDSPLIDIVTVIRPNGTISVRFTRASLASPEKWSDHHQAVTHRLKPLARLRMYIRSLNWGSLIAILASAFWTAYDATQHYLQTSHVDWSALRHLSWGVVPGLAMQGAAWLMRFSLTRTVKRVLGQGNASPDAQAPQARLPTPP